jgi:glycogen phosphorylase
MLRNYVDGLYEPASRQAKVMGLEDHGRAKNLAQWKNRVRESWSDIEFLEVQGEATIADVGEEREVTAVLRVGRLSPDDLVVQLAHGRVGANGEIVDPTLTEMKPTNNENGICSYVGSFATDTPGLYGFAARAAPRHQDLTNEMDLGLLVWA